MIRILLRSVVTNNPFRYRGYYYDNDLGLYYLNARYYDAIGTKFDLSSLKMGYEIENIILLDKNVSQTTYTNISVSGLSLLFIYLFVFSGQPAGVLQNSY